MVPSFAAPRARIGPQRHWHAQLSPPSPAQIPHRLAAIPTPISHYPFLVLAISPLSQPSSQQVARYPSHRHARVSVRHMGPSTRLSAVLHTCSTQPPRCPQLYVFTIRAQAIADGMPSYTLPSQYSDSQSDVTLSSQYIHPIAPRYTHALPRPNVIFTAANYDIPGSASLAHDLAHAAARLPRLAMSSCRLGSEQIRCAIHTRRPGHRCPGQGTMPSGCRVTTGERRLQVSGDPPEFPHCDGGRLVCGT